MIKDSEDKLKYEDFIDKFPESSFRIVAQTKIDEIIEKKKNLLMKKRIADEKERLVYSRKKEKIRLKELDAYWENRKCKFLI